MDDLALEKLGPDSVLELVALTESIGWPNTSDDWRTTFAVGSVFGHRTLAGELVSSAAIFPYGDKLASVGMVLVRQGLRGRGLATALMRSCFATLPNPRQPVVLVATPEGVPLYRKLAFHVAESAYRLTADLELQPVSPPRESGLTVAPLESSDFEAIRRLDLETYAADRSTLLQARLEQSSGGMALRRADGTLAGYGLKVLQRNTLLLGPIIAPDIDGAVALVTHLAAGHGGPTRVDVPERQSPFADRLSALGFERIQESPVMLLNAQALPGKRERLFAFLSLAYG